LHGWGGNKNSLAALAKPFGGEYRVTLVDMYGFGETPHPDKPLNLEDYGEAIVALIRHYKMASVVLVGHSFGGKVALWVSRKHGSFIDRVVLINSSGIRPRLKLRVRIRIFLYKLRKKLGLTTENFGSPDYHSAEGYLKHTFLNVVNTHLNRELSKITLPVLIIWGSEDRETPLYMAKKLEARLPNAKLAVLEGAGHFCYLDRYAECLALIKRFIGGSDE
jgi:pimeloyl-ACP methyl ester carboxylesterase